VSTAAGSAIVAMMSPHSSSGSPVSVDRPKLFDH
jgi:hypothetical protein